MKTCFDTYCNLSGQEANKEKSGIFFSRSTTGSERMEIKSILGIKEMTRE